MYICETIGYREVAVLSCLLTYCVFSCILLLWYFHFKATQTTFNVLDDNLFSQQVKNVESRAEDSYPLMSLRFVPFRKITQLIHSEDCRTSTLSCTFFNSRTGSLRNINAEKLIWKVMTVREYKKYLKYLNCSHCRRNGNFKIIKELSIN